MILRPPGTAATPKTGIFAASRCFFGSPFQSFRFLYYLCSDESTMQQNMLLPLLLTLGAGMATGIGSTIAFLARRTNRRLLSFSLGLSGGVMVYVSFMELMRQADGALAAVGN